MAVYGPDLDLANRLRQWLNPIGVQVVEIDGWQTRGRTYATFDPYGSVNHHTAGPRTGIAPSLGICINGRAGLPGPLCNVHQQRNDVVNVVAAGVANHAGRGGWQGLSGNQSVFGLEIEHCGYPDEPFDDRRYDIAIRTHVAFISGLTHPDPGKVPQHFEWSTEGKIDFCRQLLRGGPEGFRFHVTPVLGGSVPAPPPAPTPAPVPPPGNGPPWPYPNDHYLGQPSPDPHCHSGFYGGHDNAVVRLWQTQMHNRGWSIGIDGQYGPQSTNVCRSFQAEKGLAADGLCGPQTWSMTWTAPVT
jgi:peptidoglycan hydrolase-like protein with peptidoglycan-binding domain